MPWERLRGIGSMRLHPRPERIDMDIQIARGLGDRDSPLRHQLHCFNFELSREPPPRTHAVPPTPKEHLNMVSTEPGAAQCSKRTMRPFPTIKPLSWSVGKGI